MTVAEGYRIWRGFLGSDDTLLVAHAELTVQSFGLWLAFWSAGRVCVQLCRFGPAAVVAHAELMASLCAFFYGPRVS